jgi:hypothetical protein
MVTVDPLVTDEEELEEVLGEVVIVLEEVEEVEEVMSLVVMEVDVVTAGN